MKVRKVKIEEAGKTKRVVKASLSQRKKLVHLSLGERTVTEKNFLNSIAENLANRNVLEERHERAREFIANAKFEL